MTAEAAQEPEDVVLRQTAKPIRSGCLLAPNETLPADSSGFWGMNIRTLRSGRRRGDVKGGNATAIAVILLLSL